MTGVNGMDATVMTKELTPEQKRKAGRVTLFIIGVPLALYFLYRSNSADRISTANKYAPLAEATNTVSAPSHNAVILTAGKSNPEDYNAGNDDTPIHTRRAWRARLATMAPLCGTRSAAWGEKAMIATTLDALAALPENPPQELIDEVGGELFMARLEGTKIANVDKGALCGRLAGALALSNTDAMIEAVEKAGITHLDGLDGLSIPTSVTNAAAMAVEPAIQVGCGMHDDAWGRERTGDVIMEVGEAVDQHAPKEVQDRLGQQGTGATYMAEYTGERLAAADRSGICAAARQPGWQRNVKRLVQDHDRIERKMLSGISGPDD